MLLTSLGFLCGMMLATRFSVLVLAPAIPAALALAMIAGVSSGDSAGSVALLMALTAFTVQIGYAGGIGLQWGFCSMRRARPQHWSGEPAIRT